MAKARFNPRKKSSGASSADTVQRNTPGQSAEAEPSLPQFCLDPVPPPLRIDPHGVCRISGTRVTLESVLNLFQQGATPEDISQAFPAASLANVYTTIAFYLTHRDVVDRYLGIAEQRETEARSQIRSRFPMAGLRERLLARRKPVSV